MERLFLQTQILRHVQRIFSPFLFNKQRIKMILFIFKSKNYKNFVIRFYNNFSF